MRAIISILGTAMMLVGCDRKPSTSAQGQAAPPNFTRKETTQALALLVQEGERAKKRFAALDSVRDTAPYVSEFLRLFPAAKVRYSYFSNQEEPGFDVGVGLYERYEFRMQLPVSFESEHPTITGYGEPTFYIWEVTNVTRGPTGVAEAKLNPAGEWHFGSAAWRSLVQHSGDFQAIGYTMITNQPVPGFTYWAAQP